MNNKEIQEVIKHLKELDAELKSCNIEEYDSSFEMNNKKYLKITKCLRILDAERKVCVEFLKDIHSKHVKDNFAGSSIDVIEQTDEPDENESLPISKAGN